MAGQMVVTLLRMDVGELVHQGVNRTRAMARDVAWRPTLHAEVNAAQSILGSSDQLLGVFNH